MSNQDFLSGLLKVLSAAAISAIQQREEPNKPRSDSNGEDYPSDDTEEDYPIEHLRPSFMDSMESWHKEIEGGRCAVLSPIIPIRFDDGDSWFGGKPKLPLQVLWPQENEIPFHFVCQINLAQVPRDTWGGIGPRVGWLVFFLHPTTSDPKILHVGGEIVERDGPSHNTAVWARLGIEQNDKTCILPRWPVKIEQKRRPYPETYTNVRAADFTLSGEKPDLADLGLHPFDTTSLKFLLNTLETFLLDNLKKLMRYSTSNLNKISKVDLDWMKETQAAAYDSLQEFYKVETALAKSKYKFDQELVSSYLPKLSKLASYEFRNIDTNALGFSNLSYRRSVLSDLPILEKTLPMWWLSYSSFLFKHCGTIYTKTPEALPAPLRLRMEKLWLNQVSGFHGAMGHVPGGDIFPSHGSGTHVLLELSTSQMEGWIWGDCYSIVFLITSNALSRGAFSDVEACITN